jgi:predicted ATP-binding protein involved in virulence
MLYREPDNRFQKFAAWLRTINTKSDKKILNKESNAKEQNLLKTAFEIINRVTNLSNNDDLDKNVSLHKIVFTDGINDPIWVKIGKNTEPIPLELISDGYNNIFGWTGYLITRLSEVADVLNVENFMDVPAIVLIDEIDTYLHPQWQSRILAVLVDMFPNIQFVVTTHSPYVVGSVPQNLMSLYVCKEGTIREFKDFIPYGADIERLTRQIFDAPVRANAVSIKIDKLRSAIQQASVQDDSLNVDKLFKDLEDIGIGNDENDNDPEIGSLKFFWRTKKRKLGI